MSNVFKFTMPDAVRVNYTKGKVSLDFAHTLNHKTKEIKDSDITDKVTIEFSPQELITTMAMMASVAYEYQKKYNINMGIEISNKKEENSSAEKSN